MAKRQQGRIGVPGDVVRSQRVEETTSTPVYTLPRRRRFHLESIDLPTRVRPDGQAGERRRPATTSDAARDGRGPVPRARHDLALNEVVLRRMGDSTCARSGRNQAATASTCRPHSRPSPIARQSQHRRKPSPAEKQRAAPAGSARSFCPSRHCRRQRIRVPRARSWAVRCPSRYLPAVEQRAAGDGGGTVYRFPMQGVQGHRL